MHVITRRLEFDAGHRVYLHESKCSNIHGHRYVVELSCTAANLDDLGRIIDFGVIKGLCGRWLDENIDHAMLLFVKDPLVDIFHIMGNTEFQKMVVKNDTIDRLIDVGWQKHYVMNSNPTAENIAEHLYEVFSDMLFEHDIKIVEVVIWETPNCRASYKLE